MTHKTSTKGSYEAELRAQVRRREWPKLVVADGYIIDDGFVWVSRGDDNWSEQNSGLIRIVRA